MLKIRVLNTKDKKVLAGAKTLQRRLCRQGNLFSVCQPRNPFRSFDQIVVNTILVNDSKMRELNRRYLRRDRPTDVLSFPLHHCDAETGEFLLGEIYIARNQASLQAPKYGNTYHQEINRLLLHGLLHLFGLTHRQMGKWYQLLLSGPVEKNTAKTASR